MNQRTVAPIITIDGPSGVGKGTMSSILADKLGWHFLESGALYRVVAVVAEKRQIDCDNEAQLVKLIDTISVDFQIKNGEIKSITADSEDITYDIRQRHISQLASQISSYPKVREALYKLQRDFWQWPGLIADGRDMGTVIFPEADLKFFMTASLEERAQRRYKQLQQTGFHGKFDAVVEQLRQRDRRDSEREVAPTKPADDAIVIDTSAKSINDVYLEMIRIIQEKGLFSGGDATEGMFNQTRDNNHG